MDNIITIFDKKNAAILQEQTSQVCFEDAESIKMAEETVQKLRQTAQAIGNIAGLAAPQLGIGLSIFIFSWNRSFEEMETVINPQIMNKSERKHASWEACLSTIKGDQAYAALVERPIELTVSYKKLDGQLKHVRLQEFAARVFSHEYDHLQGKENISLEGAMLKEFSSKNEFDAFMNNIKKKDKARFVRPITVKPLQG